MTLVTWEKRVVCLRSKQVLVRPHMWIGEVCVKSCWFKVCGVKVFLVDDHHAQRRQKVVFRLCGSC